MSRADELRLQVELIGGPYDGAPGMYLWTEADNEDAEVPEVLLIGTCRGAGGCGMPACVRNAGRHVAFWLPDDDDEPPVRTLEYRKADEEMVSPLAGRVRYVYADAALPDALAESAFVGAGAFGGLTYG